MTIKLFKKGKLYKNYDGVYVKNIKDCAKILRKEGITSNKPGIDLITRARLNGLTLQGY